MGFYSDLKILYYLACKRTRGESHAERLESFYGGQAGGYDDFRKRLLTGRKELMEAMEPRAGEVWVDMGGGTTSLGVFSGGHLTHTDAVAVGGNHITMDVARGGVISEKPISNNDELIAFLTENPAMERIETP